jgi:outer membrane protein assembly factor BamB
MKKYLAWLILILTASTELPVQGDDWPQWMGPERDGVWRETGLVATFPKEGPPIGWRTPIGGGYAGPAVANGKVYVTDKQLPKGARDSDNPFARDKQIAKERVLCLDDADGSILWKREYDCEYTVSYPAGPRTTPVVHDGQVFTLGAEGHLFCLKADTGDVAWSRNLKKEYPQAETPVWGYSSNPLLDGDRLICLVGGRGTAVVAFHKETGKEIWRALDAEGKHGSGYGSPIIIEAAGRRQLIVWHPKAVSALDPETGKVLWEHPWTVREGLTAPTPRVAGDFLFLTAFYDGALLLKLDQQKPGATVVWQRHGQNEKQTDALHSIISTPFIDGNEIYGADSYGEFRCLDLKTGDRLWETFEPTSGQSARWGTAFIVRQADRYVLFSEQGDLILAQLSRQGYRELSRAHVIEPTGPAQRREVVWSHPAFANRCVYVRNDREIVCVSMAAKPD